MGEVRQRYSAWSLLRAGLAGPGYWRSVWGGAKLKDEYDVVIVGAGGHRLATAYHLARDHHSVAQSDIALVNHSRNIGSSKA
jgi:hypothetical protein